MPSSTVCLRPPAPPTTARRCRPTEADTTTTTMTTIRSMRGTHQTNGKARRRTSSAHDVMATGDDKGRGLKNATTPMVESTLSGHPVTIAAAVAAPGRDGAVASSFSSSSDANGNAISDASVIAPGGGSNVSSSNCNSNKDDDVDDGSTKILCMSGTCDDVANVGSSDDDDDGDAVVDGASAASATATATCPQQEQGGSNRSLISTSAGSSTDDGQCTAGSPSQSARYDSSSNSSTIGTVRPCDHPNVPDGCLHPLYHDDIVDDGQRTMMDIVDDESDNDWNEFRQSLLAPAGEGDCQDLVEASSSPSTKEGGPPPGDAFLSMNDDNFVLPDDLDGDQESPASSSSWSASYSSAPSRSSRTMATPSASWPTSVLPNTGHVNMNVSRRPACRRPVPSPPRFLPPRIRQELRTAAATPPPCVENDDNDGYIARCVESLQDRVRNVVCNVWMETLTGMTTTTTTTMEDSPIGGDDGGNAGEEQHRRQLRRHSCYKSHRGWRRKPQQQNRSNHLPCQRVMETSLLAVQSHQDLRQGGHVDIGEAWEKTEMLLEFAAAVVSTIRNQDNPRDPFGGTDEDNTRDPFGGGDGGNDACYVNGDGSWAEESELQRQQQQQQQPQQQPQQQHRPRDGHNVNYVDAMVRQGYPTLLVWLACKLYPQQIRQPAAAAVVGASRFPIRVSSSESVDTTTDRNSRDDGWDLPLHNAAVPSRPLRHSPTGVGIAVSRAFQRELPPGIVLQLMEEEEDDEHENLGEGSYIAANRPTIPPPSTSLQFLTYWYPQATKVANANGLLPLHSYLLQTTVGPSSSWSVTGSITTTSQPRHPFDVRDLQTLVAMEPRALRTRALPQRSPPSASSPTSSYAAKASGTRPVVVFPFLVPTDLGVNAAPEEEQDGRAADPCDENSVVTDRDGHDHSIASGEVPSSSKSALETPVTSGRSQECLRAVSSPCPPLHGPTHADAISAMYLMLRHDPAVLRATIALGEAAECQRRAQQQYPVGTKVEKYFDMNGRFLGRVESYDHDSRVYKIRLEDGGDVEECGEEELGRTFSCCAIDACATTTTKGGDVTAAALGCDEDVFEPPPVGQGEEQRPHNEQSKFAPGTRVMKHFVRFGWHRGQVVSYDATTGLHRVMYHDGDEEDCQERDLVAMALDGDGTGGTEELPEDDVKSRILQILEDEDHRFEVEDVICRVQEDVNRSLHPLNDWNPRFKVGDKVEKEFTGHGVFHGKVMSYDREYGLYKVVYEDGDEEEYNETELGEIIVRVTQKHHGKKKRARQDAAKGNTTTPGSQARRTKKKKTSR